MKRLTKEFPWNDCLCRRGQETAYLRPYTKDWNTPESDSLHLEYSYNGKNWYAFNASGSRISVLTALPARQCMRWRTADIS